MELVIREREGVAPSAQPVEVVERKGLGHPDTMCDGIAERISVRLSRHYLEHFGCILHHNVDKILLCGGSARAAFGGGEVIHPIEIYLGGRATGEYRGAPIPIHEIAVDACKDWLREHLRELDVDRNVRVVSRLRPGSADLVSLFDRAGRTALANDTSYGAGFAPLTELEKAVLAVGRALNDPRTKRRHPELGEDIKVMGVRHGERIELTISCAFIGRFVSDLADYALRKEAARGLALEAARQVTALDVRASINAADDLRRGDVLLTVTGTSAEAGDDGQVGRGNRVCGLITPYRAMTLEAAAGKNPVSHVGKLYNLASARIAEDVARNVSEVRDVSCVLVSAIGQRVDDPQIVDVALALDGGVTPPLEHAVRDIVRARLDGIDALRDELLAETLATY